MPDWVISMGVNALVELARDPTRHSKWRKAMLKVFKEIAAAFKDDAAFEDVASDMVS